MLIDKWAEDARITEFGRQLISGGECRVLVIVPKYESLFAYANILPYREDKIYFLYEELC